MSHRNSPLSPTGWLRLARCVVEDGWPLRRAADRFNVSVTTAKRWADRYRDHGPAGMVDRSSRPRSCPHRTSRVVGLRVSRRWGGPARIGFHLGMNVSTVHRILTRYQCVRLSWTDPATGAPVRARRREARRYERDAAGGDLIHVDIKKLGRIPRRWWASRAQPRQGHPQLQCPSRCFPTRTVHGRPNLGYATCTTPSMITPGTPIRRSWLMRERKPRPHSWRGHWLTSLDRCYHDTGNDRHGSCYRSTIFGSCWQATGSNTKGPDRTGRKPKARSNDSTAHCKRNGPTPAPTTASPNA